MSQIGEAHKIMMRMVEWGVQDLLELSRMLPKESDEEALLANALLHLKNAMEIAGQIDSGTVYRLEGEG